MVHTWGICCHTSFCIVCWVAAVTICTTSLFTHTLIIISVALLVNMSPPKLVQQNFSAFAYLCTVLFTQFLSRNPSKKANSDKLSLYQSCLLDIQICCPHVGEFVSSRIMLPAHMYKGNHTLKRVCNVCSSPACYQVSKKSQFERNEKLWN